MPLINGKIVQDALHCISGEHRHSIYVSCTFGDVNRDYVISV